MLAGEASSLIETDICVIGAGAAGLSVASTAGLLGVPVVLVERHRMGGDCLNSGCVPSKALIAAAKAAHAIRQAEKFGLRAATPIVEGADLLAHVRDVIAGIAPVDSVERYRALGVDVIQASARFIDKRTIEAGDKRIRARRFVIAAGGAPSVPPIPGLSDIPFLTNESLFDLIEPPRRLVIVGGGPIGVEMAQAHRRLGSEVTIIEAGGLLSKEDPEAVMAVRAALLRDGVRILEETKIQRVQPVSQGVSLDLEHAGKTEMLNASHILVATGRTPRLEGLGLEAAGVAASKAGIVVDRKLRTTNRRIYAIGDCCGGPQFTHVAGYQASLVIRSAVFRLPVKVEYSAIPRVTYSDPEIASVGMSEAEARAKRRGVRAYRFPMAEIDRARAERETDGLIKAVVDARGRILGVTIAGARAGELLGPWILAIAKGMKIADLASVVMPYPTLSEITKRVAVQSYAASLRSRWLPRIIRFLRAFG